MHGENVEWHNVRRTSAPGQTDANSRGTMRPGLSASFVLADQLGPPLALQYVFFVHRSFDVKKNPSIALPVLI